MKYFLLLLLLSTQCHSVMINPKGLGDAQIIPYYTVNNNLNTLVTVTNTTDKAKAIKISVREGLNGYAALTYNVYMDAFDTWTFALVATTSTQAGAIGQPSAMLVSFDQSCAPLLIKFGHEFAANNLIDGPQDLQRTREGFIEIIEMGDLAVGTAAATAADMSNIGTPVNCGFFEQAWQENGAWHEASGGDPLSDLTPGSGGLLTEAQIIDVAAGINYSIPTIALDGFHADETKIHVAPEDESLSLDAAEPVAKMSAEGKIHNLQFERSIDAVSAVLMSETLLSSFLIDSRVAAQTDLVYTQPTRRFYIDMDNFSESLPPFNNILNQNNFAVENCKSSTYWGVEINQFDRDRKGGIDYGCLSQYGCYEPLEFFCGSVFVQAVYDENIQYTSAYSRLTRSRNFRKLLTENNESGVVVTQFVDTRSLMALDTDTGNNILIEGLPIIGVSLQRLTNANAAEGLLAQYGGSQRIKSSTTITEEQQ